MISGGAKAAAHKIIQHSGVGSISYATEFGKLCRSCGNGKSVGKCRVKNDKVKAVGGKAMFVGIDCNYGDTATMTNCEGTVRARSRRALGKRRANHVLIRKNPVSCTYMDIFLSALG